MTRWITLQCMCVYCVFKCRPLHDWCEELACPEIGVGQIYIGFDPTRPDLWMKLDEPTHPPCPTLCPAHSFHRLRQSKSPPQSLHITEAISSLSSLSMILAVFTPSLKLTCSINPFHHMQSDGTHRIVEGPM